MSSLETARLLEDVLARLQAELPDHVGIEIKPHRKWTTLQRADNGAAKVGPIKVSKYIDESGDPPSLVGAGVAVRSLRPWVPFMSRSLRRRLTAQSAVEIVLDLAYVPLDRPTSEEPHSKQQSLKFDVKAVDEPDGVVVSYRPPGAPSRVTLSPIPRQLL